MRLGAPLGFPLGGDVLPENPALRALILPPSQSVVVGALVKLDGRSSSSTLGDPLSFSWVFTQVPIGSQVESFDFTNLESDASVISFAPDVTGIYKIQLVVNDGTFQSQPTEAVVEVRVILVPHHEGYTPDASFIWNYLSDFWNLVPDRKRYETYWSALIQITSAEMLKLYQYQYNKSIRDIQEVIQKKWVSFSPALTLNKDACTFILSDDEAGDSASTYVIDPDSGLNESEQPGYSNVITVPITETDFTESAIGKVLQMGERSYTLARANPAYLSQNHDTDGATSSTNVFTGSGFTSGMVGATLRILTPTSTLKGDYEIGAYTSGTQVTIANPPAGITWTGQSSLEYTVLPAEAEHSTFFADQEQIPAGLSNQSWRLSSTLISSEFDFEAEGVSPGDVIEVEVTRLDLDLISNFFIQVVSVDRNRLGFVMNLEDLEDGTPASGLTDDIQVTLAADLIVPGLSADINENLLYSFEAADIKSRLQSVRFRREYFEQELTADDEIDLGPFKVKARALRVIRNRKMAIDSTIVSVPILQEYIKQPTLVNNGGRVQHVSDLDGSLSDMPREPYVLSENLDYIIDDDATITGVCNVSTGDPIIEIPYGDLIDRLVQEGDVLEITAGLTTESYTILSVESADTVKVYPTPVDTVNSAPFVIYRRVEGTFIRFIDGVFTKTRPAPTRLWSEVTYFDNGEAIEGNFGVLVGVKREDLDRVKSNIPYKSAVAGLMYALSLGPTIANLRLSAQILLGLPFAQYAGIITDIVPGFRKREDGSPLFGRILVEGIDQNGNRTGTNNIYFYPHGRQIFDSSENEWIPAIPESSGIAINPETGEEYAVGDEVAQFATLSKGADVQEYLANPDWFETLTAQGDIAALLRRFHSFQVVLNADLVNSVDIDLVAQFMQKVKAHYVRLTSSLLKSFEDFVEIEDEMSFSRLAEFFDSPGLGVPTAPMLGEADDNASILTIDGVFYTSYLLRTDGATTQNSANLTSATGGFKTAGVLQSWDPPLARIGDIISIEEGSNAGRYPVTAVVSNTVVTLDIPGVFETKTNQRFILYRPVKNPIWTGIVTAISGDDTVGLEESASVPAGIGSAGVSVGDRLVFIDSGLNPDVSKVYTIIEVNPSSVSPTVVLSADIAEASGTYTAWIIREGLMASPYIEPAGSSQIEFFVNATSASRYINFVDTGGNLNSWLNLALLQAEDEIVLDGITYEVMRWEPGSRRALVTPAVAGNFTNEQVTVTMRPYRPTTPVSVDFLDRIPSDSLELTIVSSLTTGDDAQTTNGSANVTLSSTSFGALLTLPGDYLVLLEGADASIDIGYGDGIYPIREITGGTTAVLMTALTATGSFRYGIQRKLPNEG